MSAPTLTPPRFEDVIDGLAVDVETRPDFEIVVETLRQRVHANLTQLTQSLASIAPAAEEATRRVVRARVNFERAGNYELSTAADPVADDDWDPAAAVERGIEFLDQRYGRDVWLNRVDPSTLDVADGTLCVAAQVENCRYGEAIDRMADFPTVRSYYQFVDGYGFHISGDDIYLLHAQYRVLTNAWQTALYRLRAEQSDESVRITAQSC